MCKENAPVTRTEIVQNVEAKQTLHSPHYLITGGAPLHGEVAVSGAKNAVTKMMIASLLTTEPCVLRNVPLIGDFDLTVRMCQDIGSYTELDDHTLLIRTPTITRTNISTEVGGLNRIAVMTIGPLLHRCGEAIFPRPGGDRAGAAAVSRSNGREAFGRRDPDCPGARSARA